MLAASNSPRKSGRVTKASLVSEIRVLRTLLTSAIDLTIDITNFVDFEDVPTNPDEAVRIPFGDVEMLRDAAKGYARHIGHVPEAV